MQRCLCSTYNTCFTSNSCDINNTWKHSTRISNAQSKVKVKVAIPHEEYSWSAHFNSLCHKPSKSMTHDQYDTTPMLTFPATGHLPSDQYQLYCLVTKAQVSKQLTQGCYQTAEWPVHKSIPLTITPAGHTMLTLPTVNTHTWVPFYSQIKAGPQQMNILLYYWNESYHTRPTDSN